MSGIAAIIRFDGHSERPDGIDAMASAMSYRGQDGSAQWTGEGAVLAHLMTRTTIESLEEVQPVVSEDGTFVLIMDGYLQNWEELRSDLLARGARLRNRSDAELVLHAFAAWGEDCTLKLEGEFAFLVWNVRTKSAFFARDHAGLRPLHYLWDGKRLVVASDLAAFKALDGDRLRPNVGMVVEHLCDEWISLDETVWQDVLRVKQAHWVRIDASGKRSECYWEPPREVAIRHRSDDDYAAEYRELLFDCVRRSSRSYAPVAFEVSGGLDSSANFAVAAALSKKGKLPAPGIAGYSYLFPRTDIEADEIDYARAVAMHVGYPLREVRPANPPLDFYRARSEDDADVAMFPNTAMGLALGAEYRLAGSRVAINGEGGDEWVGGKPFYYAEYMRDGQWRDLARAFAEDVGDVGWRTALIYLGRFGFGRFMPQALKALRRRMLMSRGPNQFDGAFWLKPEFDALQTARRNAVDRKAYMQIGGLPQRYKHMILHDPFLAISRDWTSRFAARQGFDYNTPMYARRYIEYSFSTPERIRFRGGARKWVHSRALDGILPDIVVNRRTKADFSVAFTNRMDEVVSVLRRDSSQFQCLDPAGVEKLVRCLDDPDPDKRSIWEIWCLFAARALVEDMEGRKVQWLGNDSKQTTTN